MKTNAELMREASNAEAAAKNILDLAKSEGREMTDAEAQTFDAHIATRDAARQELANRQAKADRAAHIDKLNGNRPTPTRTDAASPIKVIKEPWEDDPKAGYSTPRAFLLDVMNASRPGGNASKQLQFLAAAGSDEQSVGSNPYGGFLLPAGFSPNLLSVAMESDPTVGRITEVPMQVPTLSIPARVDKTHTSSVSGGLTVARTTETTAATSIRMEFEQVQLAATSLVGLAHATNKLLQYSPISFVALLEQGFRDEFASKMLKEKIAGTGAGQPTGIINAPCTIEVAKESMQAADTINGTNIIKMRARCWGYNNAIWLANHDTQVALYGAHISGTNTDNYLFTPGNGTDRPDTLLGRPIFFTEYAKTLGDAGDLILGNWSQYLWGTLGSPMPERAESIHVRFEYKEQSFRFSVDNDGQPWWRTALTPVNSATTLSPFVTLAARA